MTINLKSPPPFEMVVTTRLTQHYIPEDMSLAVLCENLRSYRDCSVGNRILFVMELNPLFLFVHFVVCT